MREFKTNFCIFSFVCEEHNSEKKDSWCKKWMNEHKWINKNKKIENIFVLT